MCVCVMTKSDLGYVIEEDGKRYIYDTEEEARYHLEVKKLLGKETVDKTQPEKEAPKIIKKRVTFTVSEGETLCS